MSIVIPLDATDLAQLSCRVAGLIGDIRSDHAGETGALTIYRGILAGSRDPAVRRFAEAHMATEQRHLGLLDTLLRPRQRSRLLPLWRVAGWLTGFLPALFGSHAVYATIDAVETFVDGHYEEQIRKLPLAGPGGALRAALRAFQEDEVHHRDEARALRRSAHGGLLRLWVGRRGRQQGGRRPRPPGLTHMSDLQVYYDGGCPVCSREIAFYCARPGAERFAWVDVTRTDAERGPGLTPQARWPGCMCARPPARCSAGRRRSPPCGQ